MHFSHLGFGFLFLTDKISSLPLVALFSLSLFVWFVFSGRFFMHKWDWLNKDRYYFREIDFGCKEFNLFWFCDSISNINNIYWFTWTKNKCLVGISWSKFESRFREMQYSLVNACKIFSSYILQENVLILLACTVCTMLCFELNLAGTELECCC